LQPGKPKVLYFGEILQYLYTSSAKSYGVYNGTLPEKYFYKPSIKLPFAPAWTLEGMVAAAKKQGITIEYATVYKTLAVQEQEFRAKNSKTPTNVSKTSTILEVKNGRTYAGVKWYPTTITSYNPLPGFNIFGTGLCIKIKNNNDKIINFIKTNGADYGWSWCSNVPTTEPDFQNILVYSAGMSKPLKYRDRTIQEVDDFKPIKPPVGAPGPGQIQIWVPDKGGQGKGGNTITVTDPETGRVFETPSIIQGGDSAPGHWENVPIPKTKITTVTPVKPIGSSPWDNNIVNTINGPTVLVVNATDLSGYAATMANTLSYIGIKAPAIVTQKRINRQDAIGQQPLPEDGLRLYNYVWGLRKEALSKKKNALYPENLKASMDLHESDPRNTVVETVQNVSAVNYSDLMSYAGQKKYSRVKLHHSYIG